MKRVILLVAASLFFDVVAAKSVQSNLDDNLLLIFSQSQSRDLGRRGTYNYSAYSREKSIGFMQNIPLTPTISVGLDGEVGDLLERQDGVVSSLADQIRQNLDDYYLEPVIKIDLNYVFN